MSFAYMPLYTGDYLRDTRHLSPLRHGVYLLALMHCWDSKGPMPLDEQECAGICNCRSSDEIEALRYVMIRYFVRMDDGHYNKRMADEVVKADLWSQKSREGGLKSAIARRSKARSEPPFNHPSTVVEGGSVSPSPSPSPSLDLSEAHEPKGSCALSTVDDVRPPDKPAKKANSYKVPNCPYEDIIDMYHDELAVLPRSPLRNDLRDRLMRTRWAEVCAADKLGKEDAMAVLRDYFRIVSQSKFLTGRVKPANNDRKPFMADLEWLMRPSNFVKVCEGKYT